MSVFIKTMTNLPEHCYDCPCHNRESGYCQADKEYKYSVDRPFWCPLVKISNAYYGRLIRFNDIRIVNVPIAPIFKGDKVHYESVAFLNQILEVPPVEAIPVKAVEEMKRKIKEHNEFSKDEIDEIYMQDVLKIIDECCGIIEADKAESKRLKEVCDLAIKELEQEPCDDVISRQAVIDIVDRYSESQSNVEDVTQDIISDIVALPPVTPQPKIGHWIYTPKRRLVDETDEGGIYITDYKCTCSECGGDFGFQKMSDAYCKYCGAKMVNSQESEE